MYIREPVKITTATKYWPERFWPEINSLKKSPKSGCVKTKIAKVTITITGYN
jgi:hypothetical protein